MIPASRESRPPEEIIFEMMAPLVPLEERLREAREIGQRIRRRQQQEQQRRLFISQRQPSPPPPPPPFDEEEPWAPVWKPLEESPQFRCGMLQPYLGIEDSIKYHDYTVAPLNNHRNHNIRRFLKQLRETRGFDLDNCPQDFLNGDFPLMTAHHTILMRDEGYRRVFHEKISFVVAEINSQAKRHGKKYEFLEVLKVVDAWSHRLTLVTLTVKEVAPEAGKVKVVQAMVFDACGGNYELQDWRFKPPQDDTSASSS